MRRLIPRKDSWFWPSLLPLSILGVIGAVAVHTRREILDRDVAFEKVRETQVQRGERIGSVESRVERLEHVQRTRVSLDWPSGLVHAGMTAERAIDQEPRDFVDAVAVEFGLMAAKFPPKDR